MPADGRIKYIRRQAADRRQDSAGRYEIFGKPTMPKTWRIKYT